MSLHWNLGNCQSELNQFEDAAQSYSEALENARKTLGQDQNQAHLMMNIGIQHLELGQLETAKIY